MSQSVTAVFFNGAEIMKMTIKGGIKKTGYIHITYINTIFKILPPLF